MRANEFVKQHGLAEAKRVLHDANGCVAVKLWGRYEFYTDDSHGIIDLLIEEENKFIIVDYKLKDISKPYYVDQVKGYINYIKSITNKEVEGYLYSVLDCEYKKIRD